MRISDWRSDVCSSDLMMFRIHHQDPRTLVQALLESSAIHGAGKAAVEDIERQPLSYGRLVTGALVLGGRIAKDTQRGEIVGLLLPTDRKSTRLNSSH